MFDYFYGQSGEMFSYFRVPKILFRDIKFKDLSTDAKTLYGILLDRMGLSVKNGWLDEQGRVYIIFPVQEVMDALVAQTTASERTLKNRNRKTHEVFSFLQKFLEDNDYEYHDCSRPQKTIENMSRKIDGMGVPFPASSTR